MESELKYTVLFMEHVHKNFGVPKDEIYNLLPHLEIEKVDRGKHLVKKGMLNDSFYFVCSGILLTYQELPGKRLTLSFGFKDSFAFCPDSLFGEVETAYDMEALQESVVIRINHLKFNEESVNHSKLQHLKNCLVQRYTDELSSHRQILMKNSAATSYKELIGKEIGLAGIPVKYLSSYLGIHPNSLSRIRIELSRAKRIKTTDK